MKTKITLVLILTLLLSNFTYAQISSKSLLKSSEDTKIIFAVNAKTKEITPIYKFDDYLKNRSLLNTRLSNIDYHLGAVQGRFTLTNGVLKPYLNSDVKVFLGKKFLPGDMFIETDFYRHEDTFKVGSSYKINDINKRVLETGDKRFLDF